MTIIKLDGSKWANPLDFVAALRNAIGAPEWHGWGPDAFVDSMIWQGINTVIPPYEIRVVGSEHAPAEVLSCIALIREVLEQADQDHLARDGVRSGVHLTTIPPPERG